MATRYLDFEGGNDANDGTTFANRKKTLASATTGLTGGDTVRVMASPAATSMGQNATWTNAADGLTLASAVTATIDNCESAWTASANVTATASSATVREGTNSCNLAVASGFTTGLIAYKAFASTDFSAYQQISLLIRSSAARNAGDLQLKLCSDAAGVTAVNTIDIPALSANYWTPVTVDLGAALGAAIQSVALYAVVDPGTATINLDNIIACKAPSAADSLTHQSLVGKVGAGSTSEPWMAIDSINGTTVKFAGGLGTIAAKTTVYTIKYYGASSTEAIYKREPIQLLAEEAIAVSGSSSAGVVTRLLIEGGYSTTDMTAKTDATFVRTKNPSVACITASSKNYIEVSNFGVTSQGSYGVRFFQGDGFKTTDLQLIACQYGINGHQQAYSQYNFKYAVGCSRAVYLSGSCGNDRGGLRGTGSFIWGVGATITTSSYGVEDVSSSPFSFTLDVASIINVSRGFLGSSGGCNSLTVRNAVFASTYVDVQVMAGCFINFTNVTESGSGISAAFGQVTKQKIGGDASAHASSPAGFAGDLQIAAATDQRHTASDFSWKFSFTSATPFADFPASMPVAKVACVAGEQRTVKLWFRRSNTGLSMRLRVKGSIHAGISSDITASMTAAANTWEEVTIQFTPTEKCVVEVLAEAWTTDASYVGWIDDLTVS